MKYCVNCGSQIDDKAVICPMCGVKQASNDDDYSILWLLISFIIPIIGIVLWIVWKDEKPESAKMAGYGALASIIVGAVATIMYFVFFNAVIGWSMSL